MGRDDNRRMMPIALSQLSPSPFPTGVQRLPEWGVIRALGADSATFLQGQLTNDVQSMGAGDVRLAAYCSAKGRMQASFVVSRPAADEFLLACSADVLPTVLKRLSMFVMRAQCKLTDASADLAVWGEVGGELAAHAASLDAASGVHRLRLASVLGLARHLCLVPTGVVPDAPALPDGAWGWLEVGSAVPRVVAATAEAFVPQMVNLEVVGGVSFKKGCYPGQEVVARSQYRGTLKRRGALLVGDAALAPGQEVFHSADPGQPAGTVALAAEFGGRHLALVELKLAALEGGTLHLGSAEGATLSSVALPYEIPAEAP